MPTYTIADRHGYWSDLGADTPQEAVRKSSNLADDANIHHATTRYIGLSSSISDGDFATHNCGTAMGHGSDRCMCGNH